MADGGGSDDTITADQESANGPDAGLVLSDTTGSDIVSNTATYGCGEGIDITNGSIPLTDVTAVAVNLTATNTSGTGFVTAYPYGEPVPNASNVNYTPGVTVANLAQVTPSTVDDDAVGFVNQGVPAGNVDLIVDELGYYSAS